MSHHILRLAYCDTEEKRRWFMAQELTLFRWRLEQQTPEQVLDFITRNDLHFLAVSETEKEALLPSLKMVWDATPSFGDTSAANITCESVEYYKVPFQEALELVRTRSVVLHAGFAYVPRTKLTSLICGRFRAYVS